jgi:hypothetical protein
MRVHLIQSGAYGLAISGPTTTGRLPERHSSDSVCCTTSSARCRTWTPINIGKSSSKRLDRRPMPCTAGCKRNENIVDTIGYSQEVRAGKRAVAVMSLLYSARLNGHDVYACLKDVLALADPTGQPHRRIAAASLAARHHLKPHHEVRGRSTRVGHPLTCSPRAACRTLPHITVGRSLFFVV